MTTSRNETRTPTPPTTKGWCPGALRPMQSGDGLIVRIRPKIATLKLDAMRAICNAARDFGNGIIDLTRRANVQVRGLSEDTLPDMHAVLRAHNLLDENMLAEQVRNVMVSPLTGIDPDEPTDVRPIARALDNRLRHDKLFWSLPGKFGFVVDSGAQQLSLSDERADIRIEAHRRDSETVEFKVGLDRPEGARWIGSTDEHDPEALVDIVIRAAVTELKITDEVGLRSLRMSVLADEAIEEIQRAVKMHLRPVDNPAAFVEEKLQARPIGILQLGSSTTVLALAAPFGSLDAQSWLTLLDAAHEAGARDLRLSPWRTVYLPLTHARGADKVLEVAQRAGFITDASDPLLKVDACPGAPACQSAHANTRRDARVIAKRHANDPEVRSIHVSGCEKSCARSKPADLVFTGTPDGYAQAHNATTLTRTETIIPYDGPGFAQNKEHAKRA